MPTPSSQSAAQERITVESTTSAAGPPHGESLEAALPHFNATFRKRYGLPSTTLSALRRLPGLKDEIDNLGTVRASGVVDATCALIARVVLATVPQYGIGFLHGAAEVAALYPRSVQDLPSWSDHVLLMNPLGAQDNWEAVARWMRSAQARAHRRELARLSSEKRPDKAANLELLLNAESTDRAAIVLPPDEAFSAEHGAEVSYIFGVPVETLRSWKRRHRSDVACRKPGRPRKNR